MSQTSLRETVLQQRVQELEQRLQMFQQHHLRLLSAIVYYVGGELTIGEHDFDAVKGMALTAEPDPMTQSMIYRTRRISADDDSVARGGLLPPDAGQVDR